MEGADESRCRGKPRGAEAGTRRNKAGGATGAQSAPGARAHGAACWDGGGASAGPRGAWPCASASSACAGTVRTACFPVLRGLAGGGRRAGPGGALASSRERVAPAGSGAGGAFLAPSRPVGMRSCADAGRLFRRAFRQEGLHRRRRLRRWEPGSSLPCPPGLRRVAGRALPSHFLPVRRPSFSSSSGAPCSCRQGRRASGRRAFVGHVVAPMLPTE